VSADGELDLDGELTIHTAAELWPRLLRELEANKTLRIGLADVTELDTAGLQLLLTARRDAERRGGAVEFADPSQPLLEALEIAALDGALRPMPEGGAA